MYDFPDSKYLETPEGAFFFHGILSFIVVLSIVFFIFQLRRPPNGFDLLVYLLAGISSYGSAEVILNKRVFALRFELQAYLLVLEILLVIAFLFTLYRLNRAQRVQLVLKFVATFLILACLVSLLLPTVGSRPASPHTQCMNNLKQLGLAIQNFNDDQNRLPSPIGNDGSKPPVSWRVTTLPYMEMGILFDEYDLNATWDSKENERISYVQMPHYRCPANRRPERSSKGHYFSDYSIPTGKGAFFGSHESRTMADATNGTSNTFLVVEACGQNIVWSQPKDVNLNQLPMGINLPGLKMGESHGMFSSFHPKGFNAVCLDGSANFYSEKMDDEVLRIMLSGKLPVE